MKKHNRGFTLVELMISITLLSIVLALAYQTLSHLMGTFSRTEEKWIAEKDVKQAVSNITNATELSYQAVLKNHANINDITMEKGKRYLFYNAGDKRLYFIDYDETNETHLNKVLVNETDIYIGFTNIDTVGSVRKDLLSIYAKSLVSNSKYELNTAIHLPNILKSVSTDGTALEDGKYNTLIFSIAKGDTINIVDGDISGACFVATAAYGDYDQHNVMLLRRLRDQVLLKSKVGSKFVQLYYRYSPPLANVIAQNGFLRFISRVLLTPLIGLSVFILHPVFSISIVLLLFICFFVIKIKLYSKL